MEADDRQLSMTLRDYIKMQKNESNHPLSLASILKPFGIGTDCQIESPDLLTGHVIDELNDIFSPFTTIDPLDVAAAAWELGFDPANQFLDEGPQIIYHALMLTDANSK